MTQEEKQLLFKDLCARLPYEVKINIRNDYTLTMEDVELNAYHITTVMYDIEYRGLRPYLRPMSSMTEEEENEYMSARQKDIAEAYIHLTPHNSMDYLLSRHFDYRGLIEKGLALEAPEGMYRED